MNSHVRGHPTKIISWILTYTLNYIGNIHNHMTMSILKVLTENEPPCKIYTSIVRHITIFVNKMK